MRMGRAIGIGALVLAVGCGRQQFEKRPYMCGEGAAGVDYIARTPSGYARYIDGTCSAIQDGQLDKKIVHTNRKIKVWGMIPVKAFPIVEQTVLTDSPEMVRWGPRREYDPDIGQVVDRDESYVLRNSEYGQRLQREFEGVKAQVPQS